MPVVVLNHADSAVAARIIERLQHTYPEVSIRGTEPRRRRQRIEVTATRDGGELCLVAHAATRAEALAQIAAAVGADT
jgi:hypothetical protein